MNQQDLIYHKNVFSSPSPIFFCFLCLLCAMTMQSIKALTICQRVSELCSDFYTPVTFMAFTASPLTKLEYSQRCMIIFLPNKRCIWTDVKLFFKVMLQLFSHVRTWQRLLTFSLVVFVFYGFTFHPVSHFLCFFLLQINLAQPIQPLQTLELTFYRTSVEL